MSIRADVVALLVAIDWAKSTFPHRLVRENGQPFTAAEHGLIGGATWDELEAGKRYIQTLADYAVGQAADAERLVQITAPYFARPGVRMFGDVEPLLTEAERIEVHRILESIAPDGQMVISNSQES